MPTFTAFYQPPRVSVLKCERKWWGVKIHLSFASACKLAKGGYDVSIDGIRCWPFGWMLAQRAMVHIVLLAAKNKIRSVTERSGGQGIIIYMSWIPAIIDILPRGSGSRACS